MENLIVLGIVAGVVYAILMVAFPLYVMEKLGSIDRTLKERKKDE